MYELRYTSFISQFNEALHVSKRLVEFSPSYNNQKFPKLVLPKRIHASSFKLERVPLFSVNLPAMTGPALIPTLSLKWSEAFSTMSISSKLISDMARIIAAAKLAMVRALASREKGS